MTTSRPNSDGGGDKAWEVSVAQREAAARNRADAEIGTRADTGAAKTTEVVVEVLSNEVVCGLSSEGAKGVPN